MARASSTCSRSDSTSYRRPEERWDCACEEEEEGTSSAAGDDGSGNGRDDGLPRVAMQPADLLALRRVFRVVGAEHGLHSHERWISSSSGVVLTRGSAAASISSSASSPSPHQYWPDIVKTSPSIGLEDILEDSSWGIGS